jgi:signal transduction histidine kinase
MKPNSLALQSIRQHFLPRGFLLWLFAIVTFTLLVLSIFCYFSYNHQIEAKNEQLGSVSNRINYLLTDVFDETNRLMIYIGKQINSANYQDLNYILSLLHHTSGKEYKNQKLLSWTLFDWVDPNNYQLINSLNGIAANPTNMSERDYTWKSPANPWTLQVSKPAIGTPSGTWVIPAGVGITGKNDSFLGTLSVGFNISQLREMLLEKIRDDDIEFIVVDDMQNVILRSQDSHSAYDNSQQQKFAAQILFQPNSSSGHLDKKIYDNKITFSFYQKMNKVPYTILLGFNHKTFIKKFILSILPSLMQIMSIGIFSIILLYFSRRKIIDIGRSSSKAKEDLAAHINQRLCVNLDIILQYSGILMRFLKGEINVGINKERQLDFMYNIYKAASTARNINNEFFERTSVDLNGVVERAIEIHSMTVLQRNLAVNKKLNQSNLFILGDELYLKQIVVSLLSLSINYTPLGKGIFIATYVHGTQAILKISYTSFELNDNDLMRIKNTLDKSNAAVDMEYAIKLIELHGGTFNVEYFDSNKVMTVAFPIVVHHVQQQHKSFVS